MDGAPSLAADTEYGYLRLQISDLSACAFLLLA